MSNYPKTTKKTSGSAALQRVKRNVVWQAGLAVVTVVLTIVIVFAMTSAWYTNIVQTSGLTFEVEEWGFDGKITVYEDPVSAAPGDEGIVHLEVENTSDSISAVSVSVSKGRMNEYREMQKRIYFYVDTQFARNGETMERVYLNSMDSYTYTLFSQGKLTLTEQTHNDALLKWQWVYDMLGYYVLGNYDQGTDTFTELEYLRPVEYDYDEATFEYVTTQTPDPVNAGQTIESVTVELKTVDGETTVEQFLQELSKTDGYKNDIDYENSVADGYYPVDVDTNGYGVYVYLCSYAEIEMATQYDTQMGMAAKEPTNLAAYQAQLTVSARKNDDNIITVSTLQGLNTAMELANGAVVQLTEDVTLTEGQQIVLPADSRVMLDLNGKKITCGWNGTAIKAAPGCALTLTNGTIHGNGGQALETTGAEVTMHRVTVTGMSCAIMVKDHAEMIQNNEKTVNTMDSRIRLVDCNLSADKNVMRIYGNGVASAQKSQVIVEDSKLEANQIVISGGGNPTEWGTDIQIIHSELISNPNMVYAAIYHPQRESTLTIYDSTLSGYTGVAIKGGQVSIIASTITGTGHATVGDPVPSGSGWYDTGDAVYIEANYGNDIVLEIRDAEVEKEGKQEFRASKLESTNNLSLRVFPTNAPNVTVRIYGGEFKEEQPEKFIATGYAQTYQEQKDCYVIAVKATD